ncbi:hypothetical protein ABIB82_002216 [Bradyrhizobium sp. i1.8.4]
MVEGEPVGPYAAIYRAVGSKVPVQPERAIAAA